MVTGKDKLHSITEIDSLASTPPQGQILPIETICLMYVNALDLWPAKDSYTSPPPLQKILYVAQPKIFKCRQLRSTMLVNKRDKIISSFMKSKFDSINGKLGSFI